MKSALTLLFVILSFIVIAPHSIGKVFALLDDDGRYIIVTLENVKSRDVEVTAYIYDEDKNKKIKGNPDPIDVPSSVKHKFKFDNDDLPTDVGPGTQVIVCIEFKHGKGEPSCHTDTFKSATQPLRITMDADFIRD
ncbi:MAG: hypothetical protein ACM3VV_04625 [Deltaproteobacteria bacterium]